MNFADKLLHNSRRAVTLPPGVVVRKAWNKVRSAGKRFRRRRHDLSSAAQPAPARFGKGRLVMLPHLDLSGTAVRDLPEIAALYAQHRFDLLGSGWVRWSHSDPSPGLEGHQYDMRIGTDPLAALREPHRQEARRVRELIGDPSYQPIDWQKDVKSGFRFDEAAWYLDQPIGDPPGADIKMTWEIGRLQHLPQMALAAAILSGSEPEKARLLVREYRSQVLDFLTMNPVRMGSQWTCTMDVGIRAANLVLAHDLFTQLSFRNIIDVPFEDELAQALRRHGQHITANLESSEQLTSNHYLADVCGLLFVSAALESTSETDAWLAFAVNELDREFFKQFYSDGVNFEGSTSYHRLSLEMATFSAALILGLPVERLPSLVAPEESFLPAEPKLESDWPVKARAAVREKDPARLLRPDFFERLARAACFTVDITKPSGEIPQIGDNDSGRFFRLTPLGTWMTPETAEARYANLQGYTSLISPYRKATERYFDDNSLMHQAVVGAVAGVVDNPHLASGCSLEKSLCASLAGTRRFAPELTPMQPVLRPASNMPGHKSSWTAFQGDETGRPALTTDGGWIHYPDAGLYIYRSRRVHLTVIAGPRVRRRNEAHSHNDRLSFELHVDGMDIIRDPGSFLYTPVPELRNRYRSSAAHNAPCPAGREQNRWEPGVQGLFWLYADSDACVCAMSEASITLALHLAAGMCVRKITLEERTIVVEDWADWLPDGRRAPPPFSNGYGKRLA